MKRSGIIRSKRHGEYAYELHRTGRPGRFEVRIHRGAVHSFLLGWLVEHDTGFSVRLTPALGFGAVRFDPYLDAETAIIFAVGAWQELRAEKIRKVG